MKNNQKNENTKIVNGRVDADLADTWKFFCDHVMHANAQSCLAAALRHFMMSDRDMHEMALFLKAAKIEDFNLEMSDITRYKATPSKRLLEAAKNILANYETPQSHPAKKRRQTEQE